jgi:hypothetical protein
MNRLLFHNGLSTVCLDTPENWREFYALKERINTRTSRFQESSTCLQNQIAKENKRLKRLARYLPGFEPDR